MYLVGYKPLEHTNTTLNNCSFTALNFSADHNKSLSHVSLYSSISCCC